MNIMKDVAAAPLVVTSTTPRGLSDIHSAGCAASIWSREPSPEFQTWIERLDPEKLPRARVILRPETVREAVTQICEQCGTPRCAERTQLIDDTAALAMIYADLMETSFVRMRLDVVETNACRKFHIDSVTARLICTYRGTGTQYGVAAIGTEPTTVKTVPAGCPVILRGTAWPNPTGPRLVHRSPPIEGTGETRLLLVLDAVTEPEEQTKQATLH